MQRWKMRKWISYKIEISLHVMDGTLNTERLFETYVYVLVETSCWFAIPKYSRIMLYSCVLLRSSCWRIVAKQTTGDQIEFAALLLLFIMTGRLKSTCWRTTCIKFDLKVFVFLRKGFPTDRYHLTSIWRSWTDGSSILQILAIQDESSIIAATSCIS